MGRAIVDLSELDLSRDVMSDEELRSLVPHDHEFKMLDGICHLDLERGLVVGHKYFGEDAWWVRGHVPDRRTRDFSNRSPPPAFSTAWYDAVRL